MSRRLPGEFVTRPSWRERHKSSAKTCSCNDLQRNMAVPGGIRRSLDFPLERMLWVSSTSRWKTSDLVNGSSFKFQVTSFKLNAKLKPDTWNLFRPGAVPSRIQLSIDLAGDHLLMRCNRNRGRLTPVRLQIMRSDDRWIGIITPDFLRHHLGNPHHQFIGHGRDLLARGLDV